VRPETYPFGASEEEWLASIRGSFAKWACAIDPAILEDDEEFEHFVRMHRLSVSPNAAADFART
jgi:hypothetical protein